jgi:hypothetical protein
MEVFKRGAKEGFSLLMFSFRFDEFSWFVSDVLIIMSVGFHRSRRIQDTIPLLHRHGVTQF